MYGSLIYRLVYSSNVFYSVYNVIFSTDIIAICGNSTIIVVWEFD